MQQAGAFKDVVKTRFSAVPFMAVEYFAVPFMVVEYLVVMDVRRFKHKIQEDTAASCWDEGWIKSTVVDTAVEDQ